jgi:hypothetical protein
MTVRVIDTSKEAEKIFETFNDRQHDKYQPMRFGWPSEMQEIGSGRAVMYTSNKWKKNLDEWEDYKHVAESEQLIYTEPGFLREWGTPGKKIRVSGPMAQFEEPMPKHFARLAPLIGVQLQLYQEKDGDLYLPKGDRLYEVSVAHAMLGGAKHPKTKEPFLFVYTPRGGVHMLLTGSQLDIEKDGIVG